MAAPGGRLRAEDQPAQAQPPARRGAADLQGAEPGGAAVPPPEGPAGGGADVPEEPGSDRRAAVRAGLGVDGAGVDGAAGGGGDPGGGAVLGVTPRGAPAPPPPPPAGSPGGGPLPCGRRGA